MSHPTASPRATSHRSRAHGAAWRGFRPSRRMTSRSGRALSRPRIGLACRGGPPASVRPGRKPLRHAKRMGTRRSPTGPLLAPHFSCVFPLMGKRPQRCGGEGPGATGHRLHGSGGTILMAPHPAGQAPPCRRCRSAGHRACTGRPGLVPHQRLQAQPRAARQNSWAEASSSPRSTTRKGRDSSRRRTAEAG